MQALQETDSPKFSYVGGILFLLTVLLLFNPLRILYVTESVTLPAASRMESSGEAAFIILVNVAFLLYAFVVPVYFFLRKKAAPAMIIILFLINIAFVAVNGLITEWLPVAAQHTTSVFRTGEMALSAVFFLLWTLYLTSSERVHETFVR